MQDLPADFFSQEEKQKTVPIKSQATIKSNLSQANYESNHNRNTRIGKSLMEGNNKDDKPVVNVKSKADEIIDMYPQ